MKQKPFDLEAAKAGAKVVTADGRDVRIICWDCDSVCEKIRGSIIGLVRDDNGMEQGYQYGNDGVFVYHKFNEYADRLNLMMATDNQGNCIYNHHIGYANIFVGAGGQRYLGSLCKTKEEAEAHKMKSTIVTAKVTWEE